MKPFEFGVQPLEIETLVRLAGSPGTPVTISGAALERIDEAATVLAEQVESGAAIYGVTTGLGAKVRERLGENQRRHMALGFLRGRAQATGTPLSPGQVRAAMVVRLHTLTAGKSLGRRAVAEVLRDCLAAGITPCVGELAAIGAGDLCWGATLGLALTGEGRMMDARGEIRDAGELLAENDIVPLVPRDGDGMALANHACFTAAFAALSLDHAGVLLESAQAAAAMSLEGFGANLSVWQPAALDAREQPGQRKAVERLSSLLRGSRLLEGGAGRRLQDPLSVRTVAPVHGAVYASIEWARPVAEAEINGVSDNPVVDTVGRRVVPSTGFHTPLVTVAMHTVAHALQQLAVAQVARMSKLLSPRHCGLTPFLARDASDSNGFAPVLKIAEAHLAEIHRAAGPSALWPSVGADGTEDVLTNAPETLRALDRLVAHGHALCAMELMMAAQALELRGEGAFAARGIAALHRKVRDCVGPLEEDRSLAGEVEALTARVAAGEFVPESVSA